MVVEFQTDTDGLVVTTTVAFTVSEHEPLETITEYDVVTVGETLTAAVVAPLLHTYAVPPDAVRIADWPEQIVLFVALAVILPVAATVMADVEEQPLASVIVTE
jgi:hypothetical protein